MRMRGLIVLAIIAALLGAPSIASGAGNSLASPTASPRSGNTATVFTFGVDYDGQFAATTVTVSVADLELPLTLVGGTPLVGTWSVSTLLAPGTWTPTFTAIALRGNTASITGATVTVAGLATPAPTPAATVSTSTSPSSNDVDGDQPFLPGGTAPPEDHAPASAEDATPADTGGGPGPGTDGLSSATGSPASGDAGDGGDAAAGPTAPGPVGDPHAAPRMVPAADDPDQAGDPRAGTSDGLLALVLIVGLSGVAAVAIVGTALLAFGRRRRGEPEPANASKQPTGADTESLLERRIVRRSKIRLADDPIVAAMGVDDHVDARRRRSGPRSPIGDARERPSRGRR